MRSCVPQDGDIDRGRTRTDAASSVQIKVLNVIIESIQPGIECCIYTKGTKIK